MPGAKKEWDGWRKTWQDLRSRTKTKAGGNKKKANGTGGGPYKEDPISEVEEQILEIVKKVSVEGHDANESTTLFNFNDMEVENLQDADIDNFTMDGDPANSNLNVEFAAKSTFETEHDLHDITNIATNNDVNQIKTHISQDKDLPPKSVDISLSNKSKKLIKRTIPKKLEYLINSATAATCFKDNLNKKVDVKENYYNEKLIILRDIKKLKERKVVALEYIGESLATIADSIS